MTSLVKAWALRNAPVLAIFAAIFAIWELATWLLQVPDFILPSPSAIIEKISSTRRLLLSNAVVTSTEVLLGFGLSVATGIPLAVAAVYSRVFERVAFPFMVSLQTIPKVALAPIWFWLRTVFGSSTTRSPRH